MSQTFDPRQRNVSKARRTLRRWFPERQIIIRSGETVRSLRVSTASQAILAVAGLAVGGWVAFSSAMYVGHGQIIASKETELDRAQSAYKGLLAQVSVYKERIAGITDSLERNHAHILSLVDQNLTLDDRLHTMEERLASTAQERDMIERQSADLAGAIRKLKSEIASAAAQGADGPEGNAVAAARVAPASLVDELASVEMRRVLATRERDALRAELLRLEHGFDTPDGDDVIATDLDSIEAELRRVVTQRDIAHAERAAMQDRVAQLEAQVADMEEAQLALYGRFSELAADKVKEVEKTLSSTGIDLPALVERTRKRYGIGGPFIPDTAVPEADLSPLEAQRDDVSLKLDRLETLDRLSRTLPLLTPLNEDYRVSSTFGRRSDPFNGRAARHEGLDMVADYKSPVVAPGPGKVVYAGWRGRYGRLVEIDHGMGLRTRYGHLAKVSVKKGQRVEPGTEIGLLGNSGRSTGAHLHYEVLINGEPHDPTKFIKAGSDVFFKG